MATSSPLPAAFPIKREILALTGLRGIAAFWVVLCHYSLEIRDAVGTPPAGS